MGECPRLLNKTAIGEQVAKMTGDPWYKDSIKHLREMRAEAADRVREAHRWLDGWDMSELRNRSEHLQDRMRSIDVEEITDLTRRVVQRVQDRMGTKEQDGDDTSCLKSAACYELWDEGSCLESREGQGLMKGEPCVWCGGGPCTSADDLKCQPRKWLMEGEGKDFDAFMAKANHSVASRACGVAGHLANELLEELKAHRNLKCSRGSSKMQKATGGAR